MSTETPLNARQPDVLLLFEEVGCGLAKLEIETDQPDFCHVLLRKAGQIRDAFLAATQYAVCMYCGQKQPKIEPYDREKVATMLAEHVEHCPTHPINQWAEANRTCEEYRQIIAANEVYCLELTTRAEKAEAHARAVLAEAERALRERAASPKSDFSAEQGLTEAADLLAGMRGDK